jgi:hypothetical protein
VTRAPGVQASANEQGGLSRSPPFVRQPDQCLSGNQGEPHGWLADCEKLGMNQGPGTTKVNFSRLTRDSTPRRLPQTSAVPSG